MRIRLLLDTVVSEDEIPRLAELIAEQAVATISFEGHPLMGGRFMGAQPVGVEESDAQT
jgi:hypothetical protein